MSDKPKKPTPDRLADVLQELNDGVPPDPEMTPEAHYAAAEVRLALATRADAVIRERAELDMLPSHTIQTAFDRHCGLANLHRLMAETGLAFKPELTVSLGEKELRSPLCGRCEAAGLTQLATGVNARNWPRCADCAVLDQGEEAARVNPPAAPPPLMQPRLLVHIVMETGEVDGVYDTESEAIKRRDDLNVRAGAPDASVVSKYVSSPRGMQPAPYPTFRGLCDERGRCECCTKLFFSPSATHKEICGDCGHGIKAHTDNETVTVKAKLCAGLSAKDGKHCQRENFHEGPCHFKVADD